MKPVGHFVVTSTASTAPNRRCEHLIIHPTTKLRLCCPVPPTTALTRLPVLTLLKTVCSSPLAHLPSLPPLQSCLLTSLRSPPPRAADSLSKRQQPQAALEHLAKGLRVARRGGTQWGRGKASTRPREQGLPEGPGTATSWPKSAPIWRKRGENKRALCLCPSGCLSAPGLSPCATGLGRCATAEICCSGRLSAGRGVVEPARHQAEMRGFQTLLQGPEHTRTEGPFATYGGCWVHFRHDAS